MTAADRQRRYRAALRAERPATWVDGRSRAARVAKGASENINGRLLAAMREAARLSAARRRGALHLLDKPARAYRRQSATSSPLEDLPDFPDEYSDR